MPPDDLNGWKELALTVGVLGGGLWAVVRFVFEPHVRKVVKAVMREETQQLSGVLERLRNVEDAVNDLRKDGKAQDTALDELRSETNEGFRRLTLTLDRIDLRSQETSHAVARIEGQLEALK
jgi:response regulator RpfG family c-di-GMP phosphodiesterase